MGADLLAVARDGTLFQGQDSIALDTPAWFAWLEQSEAFAYQHAGVRITVRKEPRPRGGTYWRAYRKYGARLYRTYLGTSATLTAAKLASAAREIDSKIAQRLNGSTPVAEPSSLKVRRTRSVAPALLGREVELAAARALLEQGTPLLTLTGPGGTGKTALARALAEEASDAGLFADDVAFVDLSPLRDAALVLPSVSRALSIRQEDLGTPGVDLAYALATRRLLLVLDNCEHVLEGVLATVEVATTCPGVVVIATSRQTLGLRMEQELPVPPLPLPATDAGTSPHALAANPAVRLFERTARRVDPGFSLDERNTALVAELCVRLDGLPLAIELAAAQIKYLSPAELVSRLVHRLDLKSRVRDTPERHRGLRQAIAGSVTQLDDTQRGVFRRLGVFAGGWTLTAAEPVCLRDLPTDILDSVAALVDRSLVQRDRDPSSGQRFRMLETIREYALEELESSGEVEQAECAHATFYAGLAQQLEPELTLARPEAIRTIGVEIDNLNAALAWAVAHQETALALQLTTAAYAYWLYIGQVGEGRRWLEAALKLPMADERPVLRARALAGLAGLVVRVAPQSAIDIASQALTVNQVAADPRAEGHAQFVLALASLQAGDDKRAARHTAAAREVARRSGQTYWEASALYLDAGIYERAGDRDAARAAFDRALALHESSGNLWGIARTRTLWAAFALREHDVEHACQLVLGALLAYQSLGSKWFEPDCFEMLAAVLVARGNPDAAARLLGAGAALHRIPHTSLSTANAGGPRAASRAQLGEADFARAVAEGEALPASDAVAFALAVAGQASDSGSRPSENVQGLTPREQEVAALIARGLSSREIAEALVISVRTADSHADHIRDKLGLRTRAQIASWATANAARLPAG